LRTGSQNNVSLKQAAVRKGSRPHA